MKARLGTKTIAVILSDTFGRAWRIGQTDAAIGVAGMCPLRSYSGTTDHQGRTLHWTYMADADELAAAAELVRAVVEASGDPLAKQEPMSAVDRDPVHAAGLDHAGAVGEGVRDLVHPRFAHLIDVVPVAGIRRVVLTGHAVVFLMEGQFRRAHDGLGAVRAAVRVPGSGCLQHP